MQLRDTLKELAATERKLNVQILNHLMEVEDRKLHLDWGFSSLFVYIVEELKYSEASASRRVAAMRLLRVEESIAPKLESGALTLTNVAQVQSTLKQMKSKKYRNELLQAVENKSTREAEKALLQTAQKYEPTFLPSPKESIRYFDGQNSTLKITISHELEQKLNHLRQILSHKKPNMSYAELLEILADRALDKLEPKAKEQKSTPAPEVKSNKSRYIPTKVKRYIWQKYGRRCSYTDPKTGRRCQSRHLLQIDHKLPLALGGTSATANLRLLCRAHNLYSAEWMGLAVEPPSVTKKDNGARSSG